MAQPGTPLPIDQLLTKLPSKFAEGRSSGELLFFDSQAQDVRTSGLRFNVRLCPALQDKKKAKEEVLAKDASPDAKRQRTSESKQNAKEPFKPPYVPELFVGAVKGLDGEADMSILLNKYSLLPHHFLLCPQTFQPQSVPPSPAQLGIAYQLLLTASRHARSHRLLAFYNSNAVAGASQPWRHIQFIETPGPAPIEEWCRGIDFGGRKDKAVVHPNLPYTHVIHPLPYDELRDVDDFESEATQERIVDLLAPAIMRCLDLAIDTVRRVENVGQTGWNLLMTLNHLHLVPRTAPSYSLPQPHGPLELNALGYAGYMLVKSEEEQKALLKVAEGNDGLQSILSACGAPRELGQEAEQALDKVHNGGEMF